eukprot:5355270-Pleurochrysis_carterae.AAC.5
MKQVELGLGEGHSLLGSEKMLDRDDLITTNAKNTAIDADIMAALKHKIRQTQKAATHMLAKCRRHLKYS